LNFLDVVFSVLFCSQVNVFQEVFLLMGLSGVKHVPMVSTNQVMPSPCAYPVLRAPQLGEGEVAN